MSLEDFRQRVTEYRRWSGHSQKELARKIGLHAHVLSHKLHGSDRAYLTRDEVKSIVCALAEWQAISSQSEAIELLALAGVLRSIFTPEEWSQPPLVALNEHPQRGPTAPRRRSVRRVRLPAITTPLVGRAREIAVVGDMIRGDARLLTLTGIGGTGKTRLAVSVAENLVPAFRHGVVFVGLASVSDPAMVASQIAHALDVAEFPRQTVADRLADHLSDKETLLVLDNFEQILPAASLVGDLLRTAPNLKVIVTSRVRLRLYGEHEFRVMPLELPQGDNPSGSEAVQLFALRAKAASQDFRLTAKNLPIIAHICELLDGLPLAIELAAARSMLFSPEEILQRLDRRLDLLTDGPLDLPERQRTLRGALDWSYDLLSENSRSRFYRLGVFAGGFSIEAASAVCASTEAEMFASVTNLVDHGLLEHTLGPKSRFRMLRTVREYALGRLAESGEEATVRGRHARYFLSLAEVASSARDEEQRTKWARRLEVEQPNLQAALRFARDSGNEQLAARLSEALSYFWYTLSHPAEELAWLESVTEQAGHHT